MENISRLYVVVDGRLTGGSVAAQSIHAVIEFQHQYPDAYENWYQEGNTIVVLKVANGRDLLSLECQMRRAEFKTAPFSEPDWDGEPMTAFAVVPEWDVRAYLSKLSVATGEPRRNFFQRLAYLFGK